MTDETNSEHDVAQLIDFDDLRSKALPNLQELVPMYLPNGQLKMHVRREDVLNLASNGASLTRVAHLIGLSKESVAKYFRKEIEYAHALVKWKLQNKLFVQAMTSPQAAERIFLAKNWLGMTDSGMSEDMMELDEGVEFVVRAPQKKSEVPIVEEPAFIPEDRTEAPDASA